MAHFRLGTDEAIGQVRHQLGLRDRDGDRQIAHGLCRSRNQAGFADERSWYSVVIAIAELMER